jgi:hypothetical protein
MLADSTLLHLQRFAWIIPLLLVWELVWKGLALWQAARNHQSGWFTTILVFNTVGILPILYLLVTKTRTARGE